MYAHAWVELNARLVGRRARRRGRALRREFYLPGAALCIYIRMELGIMCAEKGCATISLNSSIAVVPV